MSKMKELREILFGDRKKLPRKKRILSHLLSAILAFAGAFVGVAAIKWLPNDIFQVFVICVLIMVVWTLARSKPPVR